MRDATRLQTERDLVEAIALSANKSTRRILWIIPEGEQKADLTMEIYLEYLCFFLHVTNRLASNVASYQEVDQMYKTIAPLVIGYLTGEVFKIKEAQASTEAICNLVQAREIQYAESKEYASGKPLTGTSTVDMLVRNIREILDTYNPEDLFQIQLAARESTLEAKIPELIASYRRAHPIP